MSFENPYDVYQTSASLGISRSSDVVEQPFFAENLCVISDIGLGLESTNSQVAEGAGTFNMATKEVVYSKNIYARLFPASTTKILTAYLAIKYGNLDDSVTVSENAVKLASDAASCGLKAGDVITLRDLLYGMMLHSGNDAAVAIAEHISGDVDSFVALMNQEAADMGATGTHFVNPNGLPDDNHYTTVYDLYLIFQNAVANETFVNLISTMSYTANYVAADQTAVEVTWDNTNQYLIGEQTAPEGFTVIGGKTGTTNAAGYCLVLYSNNAQGQPVVSIVLKADNKSDLYLLMNEMLAGFAN